MVGGVGGRTGLTRPPTRFLSASGTKWSGAYLIVVPPQNTSRCCPACGHTAKDNRQTQAVFECMGCGYTENADVVGALNVLKRGQAILAA